MLLAARPVRVLRAALVAVEARPARQARALPAHRVAAADGDADAGRSEPGSAGRPPPAPPNEHSRVFLGSFYSQRKQKVILAFLLKALAQKPLNQCS